MSVSVFVWSLIYSNIFLAAYLTIFFLSFSFFDTQVGNTSDKEILTQITLIDFQTEPVLVGYAPFRHQLKLSLNPKLFLQITASTSPVNVITNKQLCNQQTNQTTN